LKKQLKRDREDKNKINLIINQIIKIFNLNDVEFAGTKINLDNIQILTKLIIIGDMYSNFALNEIINQMILKCTVIQKIYINFEIGSFFVKLNNRNYDYVFKNYIENGLELLDIVSDKDNHNNIGLLNQICDNIYFLVKMKVIDFNEKLKTKLYYF
jgi:hypothetical protein